MKLNPLFFLFFLISIFGFSQEYSISGKVVDEQGLPIGFANVILMAQNDSTIVNGTSTDDNGFFKLFVVESGIFNFRMSYIGYKEFSKELHIDKDADLGTITLQEETQNLDEVSVVFKKPTLKKEADRLVFDVENSALVEGNILQVLKSTPGVLVISNNITVKNSEPTVYINNRKVNLSASELTQLLESSSANAIKSIEVITNPSAKYDASSGVVINIVMSKNLVTGYRGNVFGNFTQGVFPRYNAGMSHFFKSDKINFYGNYSFTKNKINRDDGEKVNYFDDNQSIDQIWNSNFNRNIWSETHNLNFNLDYAINDKNTLSVSSNILVLPYFKNRITNNTNVFDASGNLDFYYVSNNLSHLEKYNLGFDLDFVHEFTKGDLTVSSHFTNYNYLRDYGVLSNYFDADDSFIETTAFNTHNKQYTQIFAAQADYNLPISDTSSFEIGAKGSSIDTNSGIKQFDIVNGEEILDVGNSDDFDYKEDIFAGYANYSKQWEQLEIIVGLRAEQTHVKGTSISNNETNKQDYLEWFPTTSLSYKLSDKFSLYTNYKRSIQRPNYQDLNPFQFFFNDNTVFQGNPQLQPIIIDHTVFGTTLFKDFTFEAYYKTSKNDIHELVRQDNTENTLFFVPTNFDKTIEYGFDFVFNSNLTERWFLYFVTSFYNIEDRNNFDGNLVSQDQWSNYSVLQNDFTFLKDRSLNANFTLYYAGKNLQGLRLVEDRWVSSLSFSKTIINKKAVLSLSAEDLFNTQDFDDSTRYLNQFSSKHNNLDNRTIMVGLRYNFGNTNLKTNSQTKDIKERDRLKESNN